MEQTQAAKYEEKGKAIVVALPEAERPIFHHRSGHCIRIGSPIRRSLAVLVPAAVHNNPLLPFPPHRRPGKETILIRSDSMEEVNNYETVKVPRGDQNLRNDILDHQTQHHHDHENEKVVLLPEISDDNFSLSTQSRQTQTQTLTTKDLLREWRPVSVCGFGGDQVAEPAAGTSSHRPIYLTENDICLQIGPTTTNVEYLDLDLKL